jgi:hypothetical protein
LGKLLLFVLANELAEKERTTASIAITLREDFLAKFILKLLTPGRYIITGRVAEFVTKARCIRVKLEL